MGHEIHGCVYGPVIDGEASSGFLLVFMYMALEHHRCDMCISSLQSLSDIFLFRPPRAVDFSFCFSDFFSAHVTLALFRLSCSRRSLAFAFLFVSGVTLRWPPCPSARLPSSVGCALCRLLGRHRHGPYRASCSSMGLRCEREPFAPRLSAGALPRCLPASSASLVTGSMHWARGRLVWHHCLSE